MRLSKEAEPARLRFDERVGTLGEIMTDELSAFFEGLQRQGHVPQLERFTGTLRVEVEDGEPSDRWVVTVERGDITVSHRAVKADCTVRTDRASLRAIVTGRVNALAAVFRGLVGIEGDLNALVLFQRAFPGPPPSRGGRKAEPVSGKKGS